MHYITYLKSNIALNIRNVSFFVQYIILIHKKVITITWRYYPNTAKSK